MFNVRISAQNDYLSIMAKVNVFVFRRWS